MKHTILKRFKNTLLLLLLAGCIEPYTPPEIENNPNLLVVDGFLDGTKGSCTVSLSRTQQLGSTEPPAVEIGAIVSLEEKDGSMVALTDNFNGKYSLSNLTVSADKEYRITIRTIDGAEYASDFVALKTSPPIDSVTWEVNNQGVQIQATTHDPTGASRYYQWAFVETWHYTSAFYSNVKFQDDDIVFRDDDLYNCWHEKPSTNITIGSTEKLSEDLIYKQPITLLPTGDTKLHIRYSILVQQRVLSKDAFNFWLELQKSNENLGTLFDPQPSQVLGNIRNLQNPDEPVLGYFIASFTSEERIFISYSELPKDFPNNRNLPECKLDTLLMADIPTFDRNGKLLTVGIQGMGPGLLGYGYSRVDCVDCLRQGGTNVRPDFW